MTIQIEHDSGKIEVYQNITDFFLATRTEDFVSLNGVAHIIPTVRSQSYGPQIREIVKEVRQALVELEDHMKDMRHGDSR